MSDQDEQDEAPTLSVEAEAATRMELPELPPEERPKGAPIDGDKLPVEPVIEAPKAERRRPKARECEVVYRGIADVYEYGDFRFRPGQPVIVPSDVAEALLTEPFEQFEIVKE